MPQNLYEADVVHSFEPIYADAAASAMRAGREAQARRYASRAKELRKAHRAASKDKSHGWPANLERR